MVNRLKYVRRGEPPVLDVDLVLETDQGNEIFEFKYYPGNSMFDRDSEFEYGAVLIMANHRPGPDSIKEELQVNPEAIVEVFETDNLKNWRGDPMIEVMAYYILRKDDPETRRRVHQEIELIKSQSGSE